MYINTILNYQWWCVSTNSHPANVKLSSINSFQTFCHFEKFYWLQDPGWFGESTADDEINGPPASSYEYGFHQKRPLILIFCFFFILWFKNKIAIPVVKYHLNIQTDVKRQQQQSCA